MMTTMDYNPRQWFWVICNDATRAWSSAEGAYVTDWPHDAVTRIASEAELADVLRPYGLALPVVTVADHEIAIERLIEATARGRQYRSAVALASYTSSTVPAWAAEAIAFVAWRDAVWSYAYTELAKVQEGQRAAPAVATFIDELPHIVWPS